MTAYLVQAAGVTLVCQEGPSMLQWMQYMLDRGEFPAVTILTEVK